MINPLAYYKIGGRPIGVWCGGILMVLVMLMHLRSVFIINRLHIHTLAISVPLFVLAFIVILRRRLLGMWLGIIFFSLNIYMPMFVIPNLPFREWWCVLVCWAISALGIASLISNRRWFDEKVVHFECSSI